MEQEAGRVRGKELRERLGIKPEKPGRLESEREASLAEPSRPADLLSPWMIRKRKNPLTLSLALVYSAIYGCSCWGPELREP